MCGGKGSHNNTQTSNPGKTGRCDTEGPPRQVNGEKCVTTSAGG